MQNRSNSLEVLADLQNHDNLLLAEAIAWLHDMGKCDEKHIQKEAFDKFNLQNSSDIEQYDYKKCHSYRVGTGYLELSGERILLKDLIEKGTPGAFKEPNNPWLIRALGFCHSAAHTEKEEFYHQLKQSIKDTRRSNPFGYESKPLTCLEARLDDLPFNQLSDRSTFKASVEQAFGHAIGDTQRPINEVTLWDWSSITAGLYKAALAKALLESREEPPNMHWRLLSVRLDGPLFLERVARIPDLLARQKLITDGLNNVRILLEETYPLGTEVYRDENGSVFIVPNIGNLLHLETRLGEKLSDLIKSKFCEGTIDKRHLLQLDAEVLPCLTRDETSWTRKPPDIIPEYEHQPPLSISTHIKETPSSHADPHTVSSWWQDHKEDICTVCQLRPQGWGAQDYKDHYDRQSKRTICPPSCQTCKALDRKVCAICEQRREDRSKQWATKELDTTIWIDEIADAYGRIALVVGKFGLEHWFDGKMLFYPQSDTSRPLVALRVKNLGAALPDRHTVVMNRHTYIWHRALGIFISEQKIRIRDAPNRFKMKDPSIATKALQDVDQLPEGGYRLKLEGPISSITPGQPYTTWGRSLRVGGNGSELETDSPEAVDFVKHTLLYEGGLIVEQSSELPQMIPTHTPARLHRVWETTQKFWEETKTNLRSIIDETESEKPAEQNKIDQLLRLQIRGVFTPEQNTSNSLGSFHTYELKLGNVNLSVIHTRLTETKEWEFLTADNLQRVALLLNPSGKPPENYSVAAHAVQDALLKQGTLKIEEPTGYGSPNKTLGKLLITKEITPVNIPYTPAITILTEPRTFMTIVPADKALYLARAIKNKYEKEMGKVRNRLPLLVGIVFAGSRTPLPAILNAGRRMLEQSADKEKWRVEQINRVFEPINSGERSLRGQVNLVEQIDRVFEPINPVPWPSKIEMSLEKGKQSLSIETDTVMGNRTTADFWYPYWHVEEDINGTVPLNREMQFKDKNDRVWVHAFALEEGDIVSFTPSRFDFEFLDTAARRFEVSYESDKRRGSIHPCRPYYLEQLVEFKKLWEMLSNRDGLTTTQIHNFVGFIENQRMEWADQDKSVFEQVVRDALDNAEWKNHPRKHSDPKKFEDLCHAAISGQLADIVELHMRILKEKPDRDQDGGNQ